MSSPQSSDILSIDPLESVVGAVVPGESLSYARRLELLRECKRIYTEQKRTALGPMDRDDQGRILLPESVSRVVTAISGSGEEVQDRILRDYTPESNHPSGGFFGPVAVGRNFRRLLAEHPAYVNPAGSMAGVYMANFNSYRKPSWNPDFDYSFLKDAHQRYGLDHGIGGLQHFCPDLAIGLRLGWGGLLKKIAAGTVRNPGREEFYYGLTEVVNGMQAWTARHADQARGLAAEERNATLKANLQAVAEACDWLVAGAPRSFREACQWLVLFQAGAKMYNGSGEWGQLDELLRPFYEADVAADRLDDEEAVFHIACLLLSETAYVQLGGPDAEGRDRTSPVSFLILEAVHQLKIPANIGVRVGQGLDPALFRRGLEILFEDRMGFPKFIGDRPVVEGFMRNGIPLEVARTRVYAGCHWLAIPGREYGMMDLIKVDLAWIFNLSFREMMVDTDAVPDLEELERRFRHHLSCAIDTVARSIDVHLAHMARVFPELYLDLFCQGPLEKGLDVTEGGVEYRTIGVDASALATAADCFAAIQQRVVEEGALSWDRLLAHLDANWEDEDGERVRRMMRTIPRFGSGGSAADAWARHLSQMFTELVTAKPTPDGITMIPGVFTWAKVIAFGKRLGATPNGRRAGEPVSHGPNPEPGFNRGKPGTPTQMVQAVAVVQPGYGNTAPLQLDLDPGLGATEAGLAKVEALIRSHFDLGGTMVNINVLSREKILEAQKDPQRFPDLVVRVTGFSAYFASLSPELRQYVVDRIVSE